MAGAVFSLLPGHPLYNQPIKIPFPASHEKLWRDDHRYDLLITTSHNQNPTIPYKGSAIFIHVGESVGSKGFEPTSGCLALGLADLQTIVQNANTNTIWMVA
ncbi:MAG: hypothetical protein NTX76_05050 [Alphaproteobacteria bacterium]|nr:hypothetical protein [Alphaproteobacteria bacterium]